MILLLSTEAAGIEIRRLARIHKLRPDTETLHALEDGSGLLPRRYVAARGLGTDDFAELLMENVCAERPTHDEVLELLALHLPGRRLTREETDAETVRLSSCQAAARLVLEKQAAEVAEFRARVKRGSKLVPWVCQCAKGPTLQVSYAAELRVRCEACNEPFRRKRSLPMIDLAAAQALDSNTLPF